MFLILMVVGIVGLVMMAIPALGHRGHAHPGPTQGAHGGTPFQLGRGTGAALTRGVSHGGLPADVISARVGRLLPSPRLVFTVVALYGAFGNALVHALRLSSAPAAVLAIVPALIVERIVVRPVWNLLFRFQGSPSSPLGDLLFAEARAVVPFRNGRGMVSVVRDGRAVQLIATLREDMRARAVPVGALLRVEDVDEVHERLTVTPIPR